MTANWTNEQVFQQLNSGRSCPGFILTYAFPASASRLYSQGDAAALRAVNSAQQPPSQGRAGLSNTTDGSQVDRSGTNIYNNKTSRKAG